MAFDRNHTSTGMKIIIIIFAVVLVVSMCLPFFSSCSAVTTTTSTTASDTATTSTSTTTSTVASVQSTYSTLISSLEAKVASDATNLTPVVNLGNAYMDMGMDMRSASDYSDNEEAVQAVFLKAVDYYDQYLEGLSSNAVSVDRAVCLFYAGEEDQAVADLEAFVADVPDYPMAWYNLGVFYQTQGDYETATEAYNTVIELDPNDETGAASNAQYALAWIEILQSLTVETTDADDESAETDAEGEEGAEEDADADSESAEVEAEAGDAETEDGDAA